MSGTHRRRRARQLPGRVLLPAILLALAAVATAPGAASALFSSQPPAQTAAATAATISAPTSFTATAASSTTASLSWAAPATRTGYTLSQSPGTLAGCPATPPAGTASCTATGLTPGTAYTWTLTADYNNWKSPTVQASSTTFQIVAAALKGTATDSTAGTNSSAVPVANAASGARLLVLVYRQATGSTAINSIGGTAVTGTPTQITSSPLTGTNDKVYAWQATAAGNGSLTVHFSGHNNVSTTIDVVQLSGNSTSTPIAGSAVSTSTGSTVTGGTLSPGNPADGEVFFAGLAASRTITTPAGYTALDVPVSPATTVHGSWFSSSASPSGVPATLGATATWGTIEIEINHG